MSTPQDALVFLFMLTTIGSFVFNYMSHFISQRLHSFIQAATQRHAAPTVKMLLLCHLVQDCPWCLRDFENVLPISNNKQLGTVPYGLSGCHGPSSAGTFVLFLIVTFFFKHFLVFPRDSRPLSRILTRSNQFCSSNRPGTVADTPSP
jgi:hypothetical protein